MSVSAFGKYRIEVIIIAEGINVHLIRRIDEFPYKIKFKDKWYEITTDALFKDSPSLIRKIINRIMLIAGEYTILFREDETKPIIRFDSKVSPRVLKVARTSTAVRGMIREWFTGGKFPINKWVFIFIVAAIGTVVYAKMSGMI